MRTIEGRGVCRSARRIPRLRTDPSDIDDASKLLVSPASPSCFEHNYSATHPPFGFDFTEDGDGGSEFRSEFRSSGNTIRNSEKLSMVSLRQESFGKEEETRALKPFVETLRVRIPPGKAGPAARS